MQDFIRIGGPIVSSPLNENFRRMANAIDMANTNMIFSKEDGIKDTIDDMLDINSPLDGQVCYVVSSGEFYRYSAGDEKWHKIMDIGQTFRQGFLNTGAVILEGPMTLINETTFKLPNMLIYFKSKEGDGRYLRGMYRINEREVDISTIPTTGVYAVYVDEESIYLGSTMPLRDSVDRVFIGVVFIKVTEGQGQIISFDDLGDGLYTMPNMAFTADRGYFLLDDGRASGLNLAVVEGQEEGTFVIGRADGYYYDEGMGYPQGPVETYPALTDNGCDWNIKRFEAEEEIDKFIYMYPSEPWNNPIETKDGIVYNKYVDNGILKNVGPGFYTIQQHLVLPDGDNVILYGTKVYTSYEDAYSHINDVYGVDFHFPYAEASRLIVGTDAQGNFDLDPAKHLFTVISVGRLNQIGTFTPVFSDSAFKIFRANTGDSAPASIRFDLLNLEEDGYQAGTGFGLVPLHWDDVVRDYIGGGELDNGLFLRYNNGQVETEPVVVPLPTQRNYSAGAGYEIADNEDLHLLTQRVKKIEKEIWDLEREDEHQEVEDLYKQAIRYRLWEDESDIAQLQTDVSHKVDKSFLLNGHALDDNSLDLITDDINEGVNPIHLWTSATEKEHWNEAYTHAGKRGTGTVTDVNPHGMSTDDITVGSRKFVTQTQLNKINNLPANTRQELLHPVNVSNIPDAGQEAVSGSVKNLKYSGHDFNVVIDTNANSATFSANHDNIVTVDDYALLSRSNPLLYRGAVDRAAEADMITGLNGATENQYYGTDENAVIGVYDLPVYVSTGDAEEYTSADETAFEPIDHSVVLKHLANSRVSYPASYEETKLGTNVYDLVKNHYHKVFNNGSQGPYIDGTTTQDTSEIYYSYKVPSGGLTAGTYYFSYGNNNYRFALNSAVTSGEELIYTPSTDILSLNGAAISKTAVQPTDVDENKWLSFVSRTDWNNINEWNFGNNLMVTVDNGRATINATVAGTGVSNFVNLGDVSVDYIDANIGKTLILDKDSSNNYKIVFSDVNMNGYMKSADYAYDIINHVVYKANLANSATTALNADKLQNIYIVDDTDQSATVLWTSDKIVSDVSSQIQNEGVRTYNGTSEPSANLGKDGDLYILLED